MAAPKFPQQFGPYTLHELIARGGMAEIFRATMKGVGGFEKTVAIKKILPHLAENDEFISMLKEEAQIIVSINHANIAQVLDLGRIEDDYYIAMEYIHGIDLSTVVKDLKETNRTVPVEHAVYITSCVAAGLHVAHNKCDANGNPMNVVHRDVSPHNVLLSFAGDVKIIDFGVAKAAGREGHTQIGVIKGKLLYMAPEQAMAKDLDGRADLFAMGLILYRMLTNHLPFEGNNEFQIYNSILSKEIPPPRAFNPEIPQHVEQIVMKLLQRDPDMRYQDGYSAKIDLDRALQQLSPGYSNSRLSRWVETDLAHLIERRRMRQSGQNDAPATPSHNRMTGDVHLPEIQIESQLDAGVPDFASDWEDVDEEEDTINVSLESPEAMELLAKARQEREKYKELRMSGEIQMPAAAPWDRPQAQAPPPDDEDGATFQIDNWSPEAVMAMVGPEAAEVYGQGPSTHLSPPPQFAPPPQTPAGSGMFDQPSNQPQNQAPSQFGAPSASGPQPSAYGSGQYQQPPAHHSGALHAPDPHGSGMFGNPAGSGQFAAPGPPRTQSSPGQFAAPAPARTQSSPGQIGAPDPYGSGQFGAPGQFADPHGSGQFSAPAPDPYGSGQFGAPDASYGSGQFGAPSDSGLNQDPYGAGMSPADDLAQSGPLGAVLQPADSGSSKMIRNVVVLVLFAIVVAALGWYVFGSSQEPVEVPAVPEVTPPEDPAAQNNAEAADEPPASAAQTAGQEPADEPESPPADDGKKVKIVADSTPSGATVFLDGNEIGQTPLRGEIPFAEVEGVLKFELEGHEAKEVRIIPMMDVERDVELTKTEGALQAEEAVEEAPEPTPPKKKKRRKRRRKPKKKKPSVPLLGDDKSDVPVF